MKEPPLAQYFLAFVNARHRSLSMGGICLEVAETMAGRELSDEKTW